MDRILSVTMYWKSVEQYFVVMFRFYPVCTFGKLINFELNTVRSEMI